MDQLSGSALDSYLPSTPAKPRHIVTVASVLTVSRSGQPPEAEMHYPAFADIQRANFHAKKLKFVHPELASRNARTRLPSSCSVFAATTKGDQEACGLGHCLGNHVECQQMESDGYDQNIS